MKIDYKKAFINLLIASVLGSAVVAVVAIMVGDIDESVGKAIGSLFLILVHALILLGIMSTYEAKPKKSQLRTLSSVYPASIGSWAVLTVLSTVFSVVAVWVEGDVLISKFYAGALIVAVAVWPIEAMYTIGQKLKNHLKWLGLAGAFFLTLLVVMLVNGIWVEFDNLHEMYSRATASVAVLSSALALLVMVLYAMHLNSHKDEQNVLATHERGKGDTVLHVVLVLIFIFFVLPIVGGLIGSLVDYIDDPESGYDYYDDGYSDDDYWD